jgi:hypothetical protein
MVLQRIWYGLSHKRKATQAMCLSHSRAVSYLSTLLVDHPTAIRTYDYSLALDLIIPIFKGIRTFELLISSQ